MGLKAPTFAWWDAVEMPLDEHWGVVKYNGTEVENCGTVFWYVYHVCGELAYGQQAPSPRCWKCAADIPNEVLGYYALCVNQNIGS